MKTLIVIAALIASLAVTGEMDYQDQQLQESDYCDMVEQGAWPNFKNIDCK